MSQHKAASLTSTLFARKGRASPASLLIAEMDGSTPEIRDLQPKHPNGAAEGSGLNGHARKAPQKKPAAEELPLLAYVEAQVAQEDGAQEDGAQEGKVREADVREEGEKASARADAGAQEEASAAGASASVGEARPAASLLDSAARALRQANGRVPAMTVAAGAIVPAEPAVAAAPGDAPDDAPNDAKETAAERAPATAAPEEPDDFLEAEIVSGDANVAAIEDAPQDETGEGDAVAAEPEAEAEPAEPATVETEAPEAVAKDVAGAAEPAAGEGAEVEMAPAGPAPGNAPVAARQLDAETALSATVALRQAAALRATPMPNPAPREAAAAATAAPPKRDAATLPWRSAAVVVLGVALGLGAYVALSGDPATPPTGTAQQTAEQATDRIPAESTAPVAAEGTAAGQSGTEQAAAATQAPASSAAPLAAADVNTSADPAVEAPAAAAVALPEPSFDIIRIEPDGQSIIAGRAQPGSEWILLNNGEPIASIRADANGEWVVLPDASLVPGANAFSLVPKAERGKVAIPAPAAPSPGGEAAGNSEAPAAPSPGADAGTAVSPAPARALADNGAGVALPKPKPSTLAAAAPARAELSGDGAYELQVASVRQSVDAERERDRLALVFPQLLGALDLRVQQASVEGAGTFFRVRSGAIADLGAAREVCRRLEAAGQGCLVVRRPPKAAPSPTEVVQEKSGEHTPPEQQAQRP